jgi:hypothetical protein
MKTDLVSVQIGPLGEWGSPTRANEKVLYATSTATTSLGKVRDDWDAQLIAGSYDDQCGRQADHCLAAYYVQHGRGGSRIGRSGARRPFPSAESIAEAIHSELGAVGLHVVSISFQKPWALAPTVTVEARHECAAATAFGRTGLKLDVAGFFIRMIDPSGRVFYFVASAGSSTVSGPAIPGCPLPHL